jgi:hypothetical protein
MIEIIVLYFLCKNIGQLAVSKGLKPMAWKIYTILAWIAGELLGVVFGSVMFGVNIEVYKYTNELGGLMLFALVCAFGGYLLVRRILEIRPNRHSHE